LRELEHCLLLLLGRGAGAAGHQRLAGALGYLERRRGRIDVVRDLKAATAARVREVRNCVRAHARGVLDRA
jgi:hypothetical protein